MKRCVEAIERDYKEAYGRKCLKKASFATICDPFGEGNTEPVGFYCKEHKPKSIPNYVRVIKI